MLLLLLLLFGRVHARLSCVKLLPFWLAMVLDTCRRLAAQGRRVVGSRLAFLAHQSGAARGFGLVEIRTIFEQVEPRQITRAAYVQQSRGGVSLRHRRGSSSKCMLRMYIQRTRWKGFNIAAVPSSIPSLTVQPLPVCCFGERLFFFSSFYNHPLRVHCCTGL